ncbi:uncharacterized protein LOC135498493 [Lineus longissimus]|uniref:uncharacterized protein LOC135498493 n=1 Tax=Lineus longissimus TaxID=88925 RepID=UPI00315DB1AC
MGSVYLQIFLLTLWVNLFIGIEGSDAEKTSSALLVDSDGKFKVSQITASGITDNKVLQRLQQDCCETAAGTASGLCLSPTSNLTIEIEFEHQTLVDTLLIQTPKDFSYGYIKTFKIMYKKRKADKGVLYFTKPEQTWTVFANDPAISDKEQTISLAGREALIVEKFIIQIESFQNQPCLRMEVLGCSETDCPLMWNPPILDAVDTGANENAVHFRCRISDRDSKPDGVLHKAFWIYDSKNLSIDETANPTKDIIVSTQHQSKFYDHLPLIGSNQHNGGLKCSVVACPATGCTDWTSSPKESNELLPNITYDLGTGKSNVTLKMGRDGVPIHFKLNAPPVLFLKRDYLKSHGSSVLVQALFEKRPDDQCKTSTKGRDDVKLLHVCGRDVNSVNWATSHKLVLKAVTHGLYSPAQVTRRFSFELKHIDNSSNHIWKTNLTKTLLDVVVESSWRRGWDACSVFSDPHLYTFDHLRYQTHVQGEFILYRNNKHRLQINAIFTPCSWSKEATCTCGVAVKAGDDVVVLSRCPTETPSSNLLNVYVWQNGDLTPGFRIYTSSRFEYHVYLPIGTYIIVWSYPWTVNLLVQAALGDIGETEGLCGYHDGNRTDDLRDKSGNVFSVPNNRSYFPFLNDYTKKWKDDTKPCESIFKGVTPDPKPVPVKTYCACVVGSDSWDCGENTDSVPCLPSWVTDITDDTEKLPVRRPSLNTCEEKPIPKGRKKREAVYSPPAGEDDEYRSIVFDPKFVPKSISWPTASGWTKEKAKKYCEDFLSTNAAVKNCEVFMGKTFENEINACVFDIQATDGTEFAQSTLESIITQCLSEAHKYPATTTVLPGGLQRSFLYESLCLDNCSNNGVCKDAVCVCHPGFYGSTCSLTKDVPPNIVYMARNGLCNTRTRTCTKSYIYGTGQIDSSDLKCRMTPYNYHSGIRDLKSQFTSSAIYLNFNKLACPHNEKNGTFLVAVSNNNGKDYSKDELLFLAYDSACHSCSSVDQEDKKAICTQETTGCAVGLACYLDGEVDEESICRICDTNRNIDNWSVNTAYSNCTKVPGDDIALIAGVTTAAVLVVAIIIIVVLTLKFCGRKKSVGPPSAADIKTEARASESTASETPENAERKLSSVSVNFITPALTP